MTPSDRGMREAGQVSVDLVVAGAGIMGLWMALKAARAGLSVLLADGKGPGSGASGGFLGALMPHMPERWNGKKAFQFESLVKLEQECERLKAETGIDPLYARCGRMIPILNERQHTLHQQRIADAAANWGERFSWQVLRETPDPALIATEAAPHGVVHESLSARVHPPSLLQALLAALRMEGDFVQYTSHNIVNIEGKGSNVCLDNGEVIGAGHVVLANGLGAFPMIAHLVGKPEIVLGSAVKGQAALLATGETGGVGKSHPLIFDNGIYVIGHGDRTIAVGSTSENEFSQEFETDDLLNKLLERAAILSPCIAGRPVLKRWAGLRPRAVGRDPMVGPLPGVPRVLAMTGGFKISFGIASLLADKLLDCILCPQEPALPHGFFPAAHISKIDKSSSIPKLDQPLLDR